MVIFQVGKGNREQLIVEVCFDILGSKREQLMVEVDFDK